VTLQGGVATTQTNPRARVGQTRPRDTFYTWVAVCTFLIIFAGFARTYYLKALFGTPALPLLLHLHGLIFTLWFALFFIQARLIARHRVDLHRRLGIAGVVLAPVAGCVALAVAFRAERRLFLSAPGSLTNLRVRPVAMDFGTSLMFLTLAITALCLRRRPEAHKRVMLLACCSILLPAIGRIPFLFHAVIRSNGGDCILRLVGAERLSCRPFPRSCWLAAAMCGSDSSPGW
jgi:hypothetical protein